jgi:hydroxymethylbilane synthase
VKALRGDVEIRGIRGNVDTRVRKATEGDYDAVVLARAGLVRAGLAEAIAEVFGPERMLSAPGQGALALECRSADGETLAVLGAVADEATRVAVEAERRVLALAGGGCHLALGALGRVEGGVLRLEAVAAGADGRRVARAGMDGPAEGWQVIALDVWAKLESAGASEILASSDGGRG